jgi:N6-adenosine-specific RNA methylase IME4
MRNRSEKYRTIVADPPWLERGGGKIKRGADRHYPLMRMAEIIEAMESALETHPADPEGSHLYLWVTNNFLIKGIAVMGELGFRYVTNRVWAKDRFGLGYYFRGQHELCLFGVMGKLPAKTRTVSTLIDRGLVPRQRHSQKPDVFFEEIEQVSPGPYLELFARTERSGWTTWGNEIHR